VSADSEIICYKGSKILNHNKYTFCGNAKEVSVKWLRNSFSWILWQDTKNKVICKWNNSIFELNGPFSIIYCIFTLGKSKIHKWIGLFSKSR
jgi:hypothetical protein